MKRLLTLLLAAATVLMAVPAFAQVANSPHDFAGVTGYAQCEVCHVPHAAGGSKRLWRIAPSGNASGAWAGSNVGSLCFGCHGDLYLLSGTLVANHMGAQEHVWANNAGPFSAASHARTVASLAGFGGSIDTGKPYTSGSMECTTCHNVHFDGVYAAGSAKRPFLRVKTGDASTSDFCADCHGDRKSVFVGGTPSTTNHPVAMAYNQGAGSDRLMIQAVAEMNTPVATTAWSLGGKFDKAGGETAVQNASTSDIVGCQSCHSVHKAAAAFTSASTAIGGGAHQLLAVTYANSAVCRGCHSSSVISGSVGKTAGDHPYNLPIASYGYMTLDKALWTTTDKGTGGGAICTSCHKAHQAAGMSNLRRVGPDGASATNQQWCQSCHGSPAPNGHHSNTTNWPGNSAIACADCHGNLNNFNAHNGFAYKITSNVNSSLCMGCHTGGTSTNDPVNHLVGQSWTSYGGKAFSDIPNYNLGSGYGTAGGSQKSHYVGSWGTETKAGTSLSTKPKTTTWFAGDPLAVSKYGSDNQTMICESCHSVKHNIGTTGTVTASSGYMNNLLLQAYTDDDTTAAGGGGGTGSAFCVSCHNRGLTLADGQVAADTDVQSPATVPSGTHPMTNWTITRAVDAGRIQGTRLITGTGTYANAATPLTYPGTNQMDCDSCHKPHMADANGVYTPAMSTGVGSVSVILEKAGPTSGVYTDLCVNCHTEGGI